ncbi:MAG: hypothetical protein ACSLE6_04205 [Mycobacterium sp.]
MTSIPGETSSPNVGAVGRRCQVQPDGDTEQFDHLQLGGDLSFHVVVWTSTSPGGTQLSVASMT